MSSYKRKETLGNTEWFTHDRFGMFIHFGLYALPARHEWIKTREFISEEHYDLYFEHFNPDLYEPREWARMAKAAGMKYAVLTTKHHEGFCLFDSQYTDYKSTNTPYGKDLVAEYVEAFRAEGLKIGFYYSLIDWHHPDFTIDTLHPRREDTNAKQLNEGRDMSRYAEYMRNQVRELLTNYGKIDIMWYDFSYAWQKGEGEQDWLVGKGKGDWEAEKLLALTRELMPEIIIDNRTGIEQDLWTPEQYQPTDWVKDPKTGELVTWEACQTFSGSWGYYRDELTWKSPEMLVRMLVNTVSLGGNLLMNVGPTARGNLDRRAVDALAVYEAWMNFNSRSIYGCTMAEPEFKTPQDCRLTQSEDGKRIYIHLFAYPFAHLKLEGFVGKIKYAQFLHDASEVQFTDGKFEHFDLDAQESTNDATVLYLPDVKPDTLVPVIEIFLK